MPRPLVLGNGRLLIQMDSRGRIRDLYWPTVGQPNHVGGNTFRLGIWWNARFFWTDSGEWTVEQRYLPDALVGHTTFRHPSFPASIDAYDFVLEGQDVCARDLVFANLAEDELSFDLFFHQDLCIDGTDIGDTAFVHPAGNKVVHYKGRHAFAFASTSNCGEMPGPFAIGNKGHGFQGTWRDAEDGHLHEKLIEQGAVDSTYRQPVRLLPGDEPAVVMYRMGCGHLIAEAVETCEGWFGQTTLWKPVAASHQEWVHRGLPDLAQLPERLRALCKTSLLIVRSQCDSGCAILAANDSEVLRTGRAHYGYMWPRDGALVAAVLDRSGKHELSRRFFEFCKPLITPEKPWFFQKYNPDGTLGSTWHPWLIAGEAQLPIQEDETALTLWAAVRHAQATGDLAWARACWETFLAPLADFIAVFRDEQTGLPLPSYDLWEERRGVHTFTVATIIAGLEAASDLAVTLGDERGAAWRATAEAVRASLLAHLVEVGTGSFLRSILMDGVHEPKPDDTPDASLLLVAPFAGLAPDHPAVRATLARVQSELWVHRGVGGVCRYPGDYYWRQTDAHPGNPWVICTLWLAKALLRAARSVEELAEPLELLQWVADRAETTGVLAEQFHPVTGKPLSVSPLTWSHSEFVQTCLDYAEAASRIRRQPA